MSATVIRIATEGFHHPVSWNDFLSKPVALNHAQAPALVQQKSPERFISLREADASSAQKPSTPLSAVVSATQGFSRTAAQQADAGATNRFSLLEALYYPVSNHISGGALEQLSQTSDAPEHVLRAKGGYEAAKNFVVERFDATAHVLKNIALNGLQPPKVLDVLSGEMVKNIVDVAAVKLDELKNLQTPWENLANQWRTAKTDEDWDAFGSQAAMLAAAGAGIISIKGKRNGLVAPPDIAPGWPKEGSTMISYRQNDSDVVFKVMKQRLYFDSPQGGASRVLDLGPELRGWYAKNLAEFHNLLGSHFQKDLFVPLALIDKDKPWVLGQRFVAEDSSHILFQNLKGKQRKEDANRNLLVLAEASKKILNGLPEGGLNSPRPLMFEGMPFRVSVDAALGRAVKGQAQARRAPDISDVWFGPRGQVTNVVDSVILVPDEFLLK